MFEKINQQQQQQQQLYLMRGTLITIADKPAALKSDTLVSAILGKHWKSSDETCYLMFVMYYRALACLFSYHINFSV